MKILVRRKALKLALLGTQYLLIAAGLAALAYCGFVVLESRMFQQRESQRLESLVRDSSEKPASSAGDGLIGRMEIARLGVSVMVVEGTGEATLTKAAGHIQGTGLPGQAGNMGIAAHRDTFFRPLRNIRRNDIVTLTTAGGAYRYRVVSTKVTSPSDVAVLDASPREILTLVTCYPFYFVGPAPRRFIVRAERVL